MATIQAQSEVGSLLRQLAVELLFPAERRTAERLHELGSDPSRR